MPITEELNRAVGATYLMLTGEMDHKVYMDLAKENEKAPTTGRKILGALMITLGVVCLLFSPIVLGLYITNFPLFAPLFAPTLLIVHELLSLATTLYGFDLTIEGKRSEKYKVMDKFRMFHVSLPKDERQFKSIEDEAICSPR